MKRTRFGVNYVPSRSWYYCWNDFDIDAVRRDLDAIAWLGADHIRIQTLWPSFQPNPKTVSSAHLERLRSVVEAAGERGIDSWVCAFTGWLSGYRFVPPFQADETFYDSASDAPQELYLRRLTETLGDLPAFGGIDLGNELVCAWRADLDAGDAWMARRFEQLNSSCPGRVHVNGVDHQPWFIPHTFSPQRLATTSPIATLHCWTFFTGALDRGGPLDRPAVTLLSRMAALARSFAGDPDKPVWAQEFGASRAWMDEPTVVRYLSTAIESGIEGGVSWFTWWCSHDIDRAYQFHDLEYSLGLFDLDNQPKPEAWRFREIAASYRNVAVSVPTEVAPPPQHDPESVWRWLLAS